MKTESLVGGDPGDPESSSFSAFNVDATEECFGLSSQWLSWLEKELCHDEFDAVRDADEETRASWWLERREHYVNLHQHIAGHNLAAGEFLGARLERLSTFISVPSFVHNAAIEDLEVRSEGHRQALEAQPDPTLVRCHRYLYRGIDGRWSLCLPGGEPGDIDMHITDTAPFGMQWSVPIAASALPGGALLPFGLQWSDGTSIVPFTQRDTAAFEQLQMMASARFLDECT